MARVLHLISSNERRGAEVFAFELAAHLRGAGHEVRVMAVAPSPGREVLDVEVAGGSRIDPKGIFRAVRAARWADVVVSFGSTSLITGSIVAKLTRRPFVYRNIGDPAVWGAARLAALRIGVPVRSAAGVVALYPGARETLANRYRLDRSRMRIIPRGVPAERFSPASSSERSAARGRLALDQTMSWLAYIGALSAEKDPLAAVTVLKRLPRDVGLVMAGGGPLEPEVRALQAELGTRLRVLGSIGDVRDVLAAADLLVLTSRTEGIPGAVIEAGLSGVGTVATSVGGVPNVVEDARTGRLVPLDRPSELAAAITDALEHRAAYGRAAYDKCRAEYSMEAVGAAWEHLIDTLVPPETGPAGGAPDAQLQTVGTVLHVVASTQRRGAEVFADQLGQALGARGWGQQTVAVTASKGESRLPFPVLGHGRFSLTTLLRLGRLARSFDVLVAHGSSSLLPVMIVAGVTGRPYAYRNIGDPEYWGHVSYANWRVGSPLRRARSIVALSDPAKEWIASHYDVDRDRIAVIPNAVDASAFPYVTPADRIAARERLGIEQGADVLGYLGSLTPEKRPDWAIRAVAARPGAILLIGGDGLMRTDLEVLATEFAPGRVRFLGMISATHDFYAAIDLLVLPSLTEGMPAVAIEAALSGVRTIATDVGAVREIISDGRIGEVVDPASLEAFLEAVSRADTSRRVPDPTASSLADQFGMDRIADPWARELAMLKAGSRRPRR